MQRVLERFAGGFYEKWLTQAKELLDVLEGHGEACLETWRLPPLTWSELQELKAQDAGAAALEGPDAGTSS